MFNPYSVYCANAGNFETNTIDRIMVSIDRIQKIEDYDEVLSFVSREFGTVDDQKTFKYDNDIMVVVKKEEEAIVVGAFKNREQIFGIRWFSKDYKE